ncbi:hypothetical protein [Nitrosospira briensis]|nr:hypothetical protein [Nitrosospira briensis]
MPALPVRAASAAGQQTHVGIGLGGKVEMVDYLVYPAVTTRIFFALQSVR